VALLCTGRNKFQKKWNLCVRKPYLYTATVWVGAFLQLSNSRNMAVKFPSFLNVMWTCNICNIYSTEKSTRYPVRFHTFSFIRILLQPKNCVQQRVGISVRSTEVWQIMNAKETHRPLLDFFKTFLFLHNKTYLTVHNCMRLN
jgi:hypothetical protein